MATQAGPPATLRARRRRFARIVLLLVSLVFAFLACEVAFRLLVFGAAGLSPTAMNSVQPFAVSGFVQRSADLELSWEVKPDQSGLFKLAPFRSNSRGLCDEEYALAKAPGTFRIAVLGDSFSMASGVALEDAYHSLLERDLTARFPGRTLEVINFAVSGYYLRQYRVLLERRVLEWQPDLILIGFCARNDIYVPPAEYFDGPWEPGPRSHAFYHSLLWEQVAHRLAADAGDADQGAGDEDAYMREEFERILSITEPLGIPVLVAYLAIRPADPDRVRAHVQAAGLHFVDTSSSFPADQYAKHKVYLTDGHPNPVAHAEFARLIGGYLVESGLVR